MKLIYIFYVMGGYLKDCKRNGNIIGEEVTQNYVKNLYKIYIKW